jgi:hypothetical protein
MVWLRELLEHSRVKVKVRKPVYARSKKRLKVKVRKPVQARIKVGVKARKPV